jgi:RNA polymerase sigma-70 factor (subfamily 1)
MQAIMDIPGDIRDLLARARRGDRGAFELLIRAHWDGLERHVRARLGPHLRGEVEVEDVLQETCARALQALARFEAAGEDAFARWLRGIAEHVLLEAAKRARRRVFSLEGEVAAGGTSPSRAMRREERCRRLEEALASLSPEYRQVVVLSRLEGLRVKEIAARLGRSPKSIAHLLSRALKKLKEAMGDTESFHLPPRRLDAGGGRDGD